MDALVESPRGQAHIIGIGLAVTLLLLSALLPKTIPVVLFERGSDYEIADTYLEFQVDGYKVRECQPVLQFVREFARDGKSIPLFRAEIRGASGRWRETVVEFVDDETPNSAKLRDWFSPASFDRWRVYYPRRFTQPPIAARVPLTHLCGSEGETAVRTMMGTFRVKDATRIDADTRPISDSPVVAR